MKKIQPLSTRYSSVFSLIFFVLFAHATLQAQAVFQSAIGTEGYDKGLAMKQLGDGGFIIGGETQSYGLTEKDILLMRTDASGKIAWTKTYGGPEREIIADLLPTPDGFLLLAERYQPKLDEGEFLTLVKTDAQGNLQWRKIFDEGGKETEGFSISPTPDGNYIIAGLTRDLNIVSTAFYNVSDRVPKLYLLKVDANGNKLWSRYMKIPGIEGTTASSVVVARDGSYLVTGNVASTDKDTQAGRGQHNMLVVKVNADGSLVWAKEYKGNRVLGGSRIREKKDGGFIIAGVATPDAESNIGFCITSIAADGGLLWSKTIGGRKNDNVTDILETADGGYMIYGCTESYGAGGDILLFKMDKSGNIEWAKTYGRELSEYSGQLIAVPGGFVLTGNVAMGKESFDVLLMTTDAKGKSACWGTELVLTARPLLVTVKTLPEAALLPVEQGKNPAYKKANAENIVQRDREVRLKNICQ